MRETVWSWLLAAKFGALATMVEGVPFGTLVPYALDAAGRPVLMLSDIAVHTKALRADARCSLMVHDPAAAEPPKSWRATLMGRARVDDEQVAFLQGQYRRRFTGFNPAIRNAAEIFCRNVEQGFLVDIASGVNRHQTLAYQAVVTVLDVLQGNVLEAGLRPVNRAAIGMRTENRP